MDFPIDGVRTFLAFLLVGLPIIFALPSNSTSTLCQRSRLEGILESNQCHADRVYTPQRTKPFPKRGVFEVNGTDLAQFLLILNSQESTYAVVLIYARWCPFSKTLLPLFDSLSSSFPSIYHFAVEESALQQSSFSYSGVSSYPVLFFHNKTVKVRYQGKRTLDCIAAFYERYSGLKRLHELRLFDEAVTSKRKGNSFHALHEEKLSDNLYLLISLIFLISRGLFYLLPKLFDSVKLRWVDMKMSLQASQSLLYRAVCGTFQQQQSAQAVAKYLKGKTMSIDFRQENPLLTVPGWPSSSLGGVSFAEGSGNKHGIKGGDM